MDEPAPVNRGPSESETMALQAAKQDLRLAAKTARKQAAAADRVAGAPAAKAVSDLFLSELRPEPDSIVAGYWPMGDEMDPRPLLEGLAATGCSLALPALQGPEKPLLFRAWAPGKPLFPAAFGTHEPDPAQPLRTPLILLVPLLAFDAQGYRLGYGGGFYDRSLAQLRPRGDTLAVGLAFSAQQVERVPRDGNDQRLDWLVTEKGVIRP